MPTWMRSSPCISPVSPGLTLFMSFLAAAGGMRGVQCALVYCLSSQGLARSSLPPRPSPKGVHSLSWPRLAAAGFRQEQCEVSCRLLLDLTST